MNNDFPEIHGLSPTYPAGFPEEWKPTRTASNRTALGGYKLAPAYIEYLWSSPPHCIQHLHPDCSVEWLKEISQPFRSSEPTFRVSCPCGGATVGLFGLWGRSEVYNNEPLFLPPLTLACLECGKATELFDNWKYDPDYGCCMVAGEGEPASWACRRCTGSLMEIACKFDNSGLWGEEHEKFVWLWVYGRCQDCGLTQLITDYETE